MPPLALILALALAVSIECMDNPADLADQVASGDPGARIEASGRLEEIGPPALPALRIAQAKAENPAASRRLADLIDLIARKRLLHATVVDRLEARDTPVAEAVADLSQRSGFRLELASPHDLAWASKRVTLAPVGPIGFWEAVDRLGAAGGFRVDATPFRSSPNVRLVHDGDAPLKASYTGPFRVDLISLNRHRQVVQPKAGAAPRPIDEFAAELRLMAEPGLEVDRNGSPRVLEALDDRGGDLRPDSTFDPSRSAVSAHQWLPGPSVQSYRIPLAIPAGRGGTLTRFRGYLPIIVVGRDGPVITVPLAGAEGQTFTASGITLTVRRLVLPAPGRAGTIGLSVRGEDIRPGPMIAPGPRQLTLSPIRSAFGLEDHIEIVDDQGRPIAHYPNTLPTKPDGSIEIQIAIQPAPHLGPPTTLRYYDVVAEATEVPFLFEGVPMP